MIHLAVEESVIVLLLEPVECYDVLGIRGTHHVDDVVPNLLVHHSSPPWCSKSSSFHPSSQMSAGLVEERGQE